MSKSRKFLIILTAVFLIMAAAAYGYGVYYFTGHFLPGSRVDGSNCSYMNEEEAVRKLTDNAGEYTLTIGERENEQESISGEAISLAYEDDGSITTLMHTQNRFLWFLSFGQHKDYETPDCFVYNEEALSQSINSLNCMNGSTATADAYLKAEEDGWIIVPEVMGDQVHKEDLSEAIRKAVVTGVTVINLESEGFYDSPSVYSDDERLNKDCEELNDLTDVVITYDFDDRTETLDRAGIKELLSRDDRDDYFLDKELVAQYVKELAEKYNTVGSRRTFTAYDTREVEVSGGDYGWVIDKEQETEILYKVLKNKQTQVRMPLYSQEAASRKTNDIGYTYLEVDLTNSRVVLYQDGVPTVDLRLSANEGTFSDGTGFSAGSQGTLSEVLNVPEGVFYVSDLGEQPAAEETLSGDGMDTGENAASDYSDFSELKPFLTGIYENLPAETPLVIYR